MSLNPLESVSGLRYRSTLIEEDATLKDTLIDAAGLNDPESCHFHSSILNTYTYM